MVVNHVLAVDVKSAVASLVAIEFVIVVLKFASSPRAAASSLSVFSVAGAVSTKFAICVATWDSVANVSVVPPPTGVVSKTPLLSFSSIFLI